MKRNEISMKMEKSIVFGTENNETLLELKKIERNERR